jgi:hypothetical protein
MAVIQSGVPWTSGIDDNTAGVAARNAAANAPAPGGTLDPAQYIDPDELAAALTALNVAQYVDASELTTALNALNVSQYTDATELAAAIAALNVSQYTDASELAAALSTYATSASVTSAISAAPPKGSVPTATKTAAYTASVGEMVLVDVSDRFVNDAVYEQLSHSDLSDDGLHVSGHRALLVGLVAVRTAWSHDHSRSVRHQRHDEQDRSGNRQL